MSVSFYGRTADGKMFDFNLEEPLCINLSNGNAEVLLRLLGFPGPWSGAVIPVPEARRAVMRARARLERAPKDYTRETIEEAGFVSYGIGVDYLERRVSDFEAFVLAVEKLGAVEIYWG